MWVSKLVWRKWKKYFNFTWSSLLHFATYVMCWVKEKSLNVKALKWLMWEFHFTLKNVFPLVTVFPFLHKK